jgi:RND family efflux transporter MFP subunit
MKKFAAFAVLLLVLGSSLAGCEKKQAGSAPQAPKVTVAKPLAEKIVDWDDYIGRFEAVQTVEIRPRVSGYLVGVHFQDGQQVKKGDLLFTIDQRPFKAALDAARGQLAEIQATLANLELQLARQKRLLANRTVSQQKYDDTRAQVNATVAQLKAQEATVQAAQLNVGFTEIRSPINGRVSYRRVDIGNAVKSDDTLLTTVTSVDPIHFVFQGSEAQYLKYKRQQAAGDSDGTPVRIRLQDETSYDWKGRLDFIDTMIDTGSGTIRGRAVVDNPKGFLVPGMFGHLELQASDPYTALMVPDTAVATLAGNRVVYVVGNDGTVEFKAVKLGPLHDGLRVIRAGITENDHVIVDGQQRARPGAKVQAAMTTITLPGSTEAETSASGSSAAE